MDLKKGFRMKGRPLIQSIRKPITLLGLLENAKADSISKD